MRDQSQGGPTDDATDPALPALGPAVPPLAPVSAASSHEPSASSLARPARDTFDEADPLDVDPDDPGPPDRDPPGASFGDPLAPPRPDSRRATARGLLPLPRVPVVPHSVELHRSAAALTDLASSSELTALVAAAEAEVDGAKALGTARPGSAPDLDAAPGSAPDPDAPPGSAPDLTADARPRPQVRGPGLARVQRPSAPLDRPGPRPPSRPAPRPSSPAMPAPRPSSPAVPAPRPSSPAMPAPSPPRAGARVQAPSAPRPLIRPAHRAVELPRANRPLPPSVQPTAISEVRPVSELPRNTATGISSPYLRPKDAIPVAEGVYDDAHGNTVQGLPRSQLERATRGSAPTPSAASPTVSASAPAFAPPAPAPSSASPMAPAFAPPAPAFAPAPSSASPMAPAFALPAPAFEPALAPPSASPTAPAFAPPAPALRSLAPPRAESEPLAATRLERPSLGAASPEPWPSPPSRALLPAATLAALALLVGAMVLPSSRGAPWELLAQPTDPTFLALAAFLLIGVTHLLPLRPLVRARTAAALGLFLVPFTALSARSALSAGAFDGQPAMELLWDGGWSASLATLGGLAALMAGLMARGRAASRFAPTTFIGFGTGLALAVWFGAASPAPLSSLFGALGGASFLGDRVGAWTALPLLALTLLAPVFAWPGPRARPPGASYRLDRLSVPLAFSLWGAALAPMFTLALFSAKSEAWLEVFEPLKLTLVLGALTLYLAAALAAALSPPFDAAPDAR